MTSTASSMEHNDKQTGKAASETFEQLLIRSATDMFGATLGKNTTDILFRTFEILQPGIRGSGVTSITAFGAALDESFGDFSKPIKKIVIEKMSVVLGVALDELSSNDFSGTLTQMKDFFPRKDYVAQNG